MVFYLWKVKEFRNNYTALLCNRLTINIKNILMIKCPYRKALGKCEQFFGNMSYSKMWHWKLVYIFWTIIGNTFTIGYENEITTGGGFAIVRSFRQHPCSW